MVECCTSTYFLKLSIGHLRAPWYWQDQTRPPNETTTYLDVRRLFVSLFSWREFVLRNQIYFLPEQKSVLNRLVKSSFRVAFMTQFVGLRNFRILIQCFKLCIIITKFLLTMCCMYSFPSSMQLEAIDTYSPTCWNRKWWYHIPNFLSSVHHLHCQRAVMKNVPVTR